MLCIDSTHKCNGWIDSEKYLIRCFHAKAFPWLIVEPVHDVLDILVSDLGKVTTLGKVLMVFSFRPRSYEA